MVQLESDNCSARTLRDSHADQPVSTIWLFTDASDFLVHFNKGANDSIVQQKLTQRIQGIGANAAV